MFEPYARPLVQAGHLIGPGGCQVRSEHIREQVMIAVPLALVIQRDEEQVAAFQGIQHCITIYPLGNGITQRSAQPVEYRGLQQETAHLLGLARKHLSGQIIEHKAVAAG
ncbi:MAG TPA: hypothetical protein PJ988_01755, partial [Anaerolinea sp.]|nr:hypothetical protein [Anaerolinea sp.]